MVKRWEIVQIQVTFVLLNNHNNNKNQRQRNGFLKKNFDGRKHDTKVSQTNAEFLCEHYTIYFSLLKVSIQTNARKMLIGEVLFTGITKMEIIRAVAH